MENNNEKKKGSMFMSALNYGLLAGIGIIIVGLIIYLGDLFEQNWVSWIGYAILLACIILGTLNFRNEVSGGFITYGRALGYGTLTAFLASVISGVFTYVFYSFIAPDALERLREISEMQMLETLPNATDEQLNFARAMVNPLLMTIGSIFSVTFIGFIFSLVTAAFLKKKDPLDTEI